MKTIVTGLLILLMPAAAQADLRVFACEPEWASLAEELGGDKVIATSATTAYQDPHYIQARPSLIAGVRRADLVVCSGAQLEIGWLPVLLQKANNRDVMPGSPGYLEASSLVLRLGASGSSDRSQGDIHPMGNPHVQVNPHNIALVARGLSQRMAELDPESASLFETRLADFQQRWADAIARWESEAAPLRGTRAITHHRSWIYLQDWLGIEEVANLEPIPGLPPTVSHLSQLNTRFANGGADFIIRSTYQDEKPSQWLSERSGIPMLMLPLTVGGSDAAVDLFSLFDDIVQRLLEALNNG